MSASDFVETRQLASTLTRMGPDTSNLGGYRKGVIVSVEAGPPSTCTITLSGDPTEIPGIAYVDSYTPVVDETVIIGKQGGSLLILGTTEHNGGGGGDPTYPPTLTLVRSTSQSIGNATATAISWSSQVANIGGPGTWWASGSPTQIIMPYVGLYRVNLNICWTPTVSSTRHMYLWNHASTHDFSTVVACNAVDMFGSTEQAAHSDLATVVNIASAGQVLVAGVLQSTGGSLDIAARHLQSPAMITFTYLGEP